VLLKDDISADLRIVLEVIHEFFRADAVWLLPFALADSGDDFLVASEVLVVALGILRGVLCTKVEEGCGVVRLIC
jgi:hypothetical protein